MRSLAALPLLLALAGAPTGRAAGLDYHQDFESADPLQLWASDGTYTIHSKGLATDQAASGKSSFKIDLTFGTATYVYFRIPMHTPVGGGRGAHGLEFNGKIRVESVTGNAGASLGTDIALDPSPVHGFNIIGRIDRPTGAWVTQTSNLSEAFSAQVPPLAEKNFADITAGETGQWIDSIALYLFGSPGARIAVYVDDIHLTGDVPETSSTQVYSEWMWYLYSNRIRMKVTDESSAILDSTLAAGPLRDRARAEASAVSTAFRDRGYVTPEQMDRLDRVYEAWQTSAGLISDAASTDKIRVFPWPATRQRIFQRFGPPPAPEGSVLAGKGCRGEFEAISFLLRAASSDLSGITVAAGDLKGAQGRTIPAGNIDVRLVKEWYQGSYWNVIMTPAKYLVPELLLRDDALVHVNTAHQMNTLRVLLDGQTRYVDVTSPSARFPQGAVVQDAATLQPFDLPVHTNRQVWLTVHVPGAAASGDYQGTVTIAAQGQKPRILTLHFTVYPFDLSPSILEEAMYYQGRLPGGDPLSANRKSEAQLAIDFADMRDHGVRYVTVTQSLATPELFGKFLDIMKSAGLATDRLYLQNGILRANTLPQKPEELADLSSRVKQYTAVAAEHGFSNLYVYGIDEAQGDTIDREKAALAEVHKAGAKLYVAVNVPGASPLLGPLLDVVNLQGRIGMIPGEMERWHSHGVRPYSYGNTQVGVENPEIYRRNFGLGLFAAGFDGAMDWAYQGGYNFAWNDFDGGQYRDHMFSYPTSNGQLVNTVEWEAYREGVDDIRYLSTLIALDHGRTREQIRSWLEGTMAAHADPDAVREIVANEILRLRRESR